jgi:ABC-type enterochelin transport system substrate-binding protein
MQLTAMFDTIQVSQLGTWATSAVGLTTQPKFLLATAFTALNTGTMALVGRYRGSGEQEKAKQLNDFNNKYLDIVHDRASKLSDSNKKTVYYAQGDDGLQTTPSHSTHGQLIDLIGGENVADSVAQGNTTGGVQVSIEQVISWNPDVIITTGLIIIDLPHMEVRFLDQYSLT